MTPVRIIALITLCWLWYGVTAQADEQTMPRPDPRRLSWVLPIHSARLSPGPVTRRVLDMPGMTPLFLVGQAPLSLQWLAEHAQALQALGASGLAVEVANSDALQRIQATAPELPIWPVSGDDIAARLQLEHYPVLITPTALEQ
ncbi:integrating conjugative element protein (plasmid) [Pseudomonas sp. App30]|uniref:integrating conjugative element protein n=1 Tax=Pseudomonas sp. App30 TaxID=3068990 RepID=UPI003A7FBD24